MKKLKHIKILVVAFTSLLILSGVTAFPLQWELNLLCSFLAENTYTNGLTTWIFLVNETINEVATSRPFLLYGTDWLAFAHIVIGIFFIGVYKDPVRNQWITTTGIIACLGVFPIAFIAGYLRNIPFFWQLIDCSFGVIGLIPLLLIHKYTLQLKE